jgi:hypothetical protein
MVAVLIGYAQVSTDQRDLTAQRDGLSGLGVAAGRVFVDLGLAAVPQQPHRDSGLPLPPSPSRHRPPLPM